MRGPAARARNAGACSWSLQCEECGTQGWNGQMLRDYYGRAPPSFFDCCNAATGRSLMYTSVARLGIDSAARARRKLLASVFRRFTEGFDSRVSCRPDFTPPTRAKEAQSHSREKLQCGGYELAGEGRTDPLRIRRAREGQESGLERRPERAGAEASSRHQEGRPHLLLSHR